MPFRIRIVAVSALIALAVATALVPAFGVTPEGGDVDVFSAYAARIVDGAVPYRDVKLEYPPGALAAIVPPALGSPSEATYASRFAWGVLALLSATVLLLARRPRAAFVVALAPLLLGPVVLKRFDVLPALLTLAALHLALRRRWAWAGGALGLGTAVKLYPVLLLPVLLVAAGRRVWPRVTGAFAAACGIVVVPFLAVAPGGVVDSVRDQLGRHLQIETPLASLALLGHSFGLVGVGVVSEAHTYGLGGASGAVLAALTSLAFVVVLAFVWWRSARTDLVLAWAATLTAAVVLGRVLSPQYLLWLLPVVPLVSLRSTFLLAAAAVLTNVWYPGPYLDVVVHQDRGGLLLLVVRNVVLSALLADLLLRVARARAPRSRGARG